MSFHQLKQQRKDALHLSIAAPSADTLRDIREAVEAADENGGEISNPNSNSNNNPSTADHFRNSKNDGLPSEMVSDEIDDDDDASGSGSWATMSDIDSQYTRQSKSSRWSNNIMELSMITDSEYSLGIYDENDYDDESEDADGNVNKSLLTGTIPPIVSATSLTEAIASTKRSGPPSLFFSTTPPTSNGAAMGMPVTTIGTANSPRIVSPQLSPQPDSRNNENDNEDDNASEQTGGNVTSESRERRRSSLKSSNSRSSSSKRKKSKASKKASMPTDGVERPHSPPLPPHIPLENAEAAKAHRARLLEWRQKCLQEAEDQVFEARQELAGVSQHLELLQERHTAEIRELQEQLDRQKEEHRKTQIASDATFQSLQKENRALLQQQQQQQSQQQATTAGTENSSRNAKEAIVRDLELESKKTMDKVISDHNKILQALQSEKALAESNLKNALGRLQSLESENEQLLQDKQGLESQLETTQKKVRFAEQQSSVLEFKVDEYKSKWENSLKRSRIVESELVTLRCDLQAAKQKQHDAELQKQQREQEDSEANKQLEVKLQSLTEDRESLQAQLQAANRQKDTLETDLFQAKDESVRLQGELSDLRTSMRRAETEHELDKSKQTESFQSELRELRNSMALLVATDEQRHTELDRLRASESELKSKLVAAVNEVTGLQSYKAMPEQNTEEQWRRSFEAERIEHQFPDFLLSELNASVTKAQERQESWTTELEGLRTSIAALTTENEQHQAELSELRAKESKLKADANAAAVQAEAEFERERQKANDNEQKLVSELAESRSKAKYLEGETEALQSKVLALEEEQTNLETELRETKNRWEDAKADSEQAERDLKVVREDLAKTRASLEGLESEHTKLIAEQKVLVDTHEKEVREQQSEILLSQTRERTLQNELNALREQQKTAEQEARDLESKLQSTREDHAALADTHRASKLASETEILALKSEKDALTKQALALKSTLADLEEQLGKAKKKCDFLQRAQDDANAELDRRSKEHEAISKTSSEEYEKLASERDNLRKKVQSFAKKETELEGKLISIVNILETSNANLTANEQERLETEELLAEERETTQAKILQLEEECEVLKGKITIVKGEKNDLDTELSAVQKEHYQLKETQKISEEKLSKFLLLQDELKASSQKQLSDLLNQRNGFSKDLDESNRKQTELEETLLETTELLDETKRILVQKDIKFEELECKFENAKESIRHLEKEQSRRRFEKDETDALHARVVEEHRISAKNLEDRLGIATQKVTDLNIEQEVVAKTIQNLKADQTALEGKLKESVDSLAKKNSQLEQNQNVRQQLEGKINELEERCEFLKVEQSDAKGETETVKVLYENALQDHNELIKKMEELEASAAESVAAIRTEIVAEQNVRIENAETEMRNAQAQLDILKEEQNRHEIATANEKALMVAHHVVMTRRHEASIAALQEELEAIRKQALDSEDEKEVLQKQLKSLEDKEMALGQKYTATLETLHTTTSRLDQAELEKSVLKSKLTELEADFEAIKTVQTDVSRKTKAFIASYEAEMTKSEMLIEEAENEVKSFKKKVAVLERESESFKQTAIKEKESMLALHSKELKDYENLSQDLQLKLVASEQDALESKRKREELQHVITSLDSELMALKDEFEKFSHLLRKAESDLKETEENESCLRSELMILQDKVDSLELEQSNSKKELDAQLNMIEEQKKAIKNAETATLLAKEQEKLSRSEAESLRISFEKEKQESIALHSLAIDNHCNSSRALREKLGAAEMQAEKYKQEKEKLNDQVVSLNMELINHKDEFDKALVTFKTTAGELQEANERESLLKKQLSNLQAKLDCTKAEKADVSIRMQTLLDCHSKEVRENQESIKNAKADVKSAKTELDHLHQKHEELKKIIAVERERDLQAHSKEMEEDVRSIRSLRNDLDFAQKECQIFTKEKNELHERLQAIAGERLDLQSAFTTASNRLSEVERQLRIEEEEKINIQAALLKMQRNYELMKNERNETRVKMNEMVSVHAAALEKQKLLVEKSQANAQETTEQMKVLQSEKVKLEESRDALKDKNDDLRSKHESALSSIDLLNACVQKTEKARIEMEANLRDAERREESLVQSVKSVTEENSSLKTAIEVSETDHKAQVYRLEYSKLEVSIVNEKMSKEISNLRDAHLGESELREMSEKKNLDLQHKLDEAITRNTELADEHNHAMLGAQNQIGILQCQQKTLHQRMEIAEAARMVAEKGAEENAIVLEGIQSDLRNSKRENDSLISGLNEAKGTILALKKDVEEALTEKEEYYRAFRDLEEEIGVTRKRMQVIETDRQRLENEMQSMKDDRDKLEEESKLTRSRLNTRDAEVESLEKALKGERENLGSLEHKNNFLSQEKKNLDLEIEKLASNLRDSRVIAAREQENHNASKKQMLAIRKECDELLSQLSASKQEVETKVNKESHLCEEISSLKNQIYELNKEKDELKELNASVEKKKVQEAQDLRQQFEEANSKLMEERDKLIKLNASIMDENNMKIKELNHQLDEAKSQSAERDKLNTSLMDKKCDEIQDLHQQLEEANSKMAEERKEFKKQNASITDENNMKIKELNHQLDEAKFQTAERDKLNTSLMEKKCDEIQDLHQQLEEANSKMAEEREEFKKQNASIMDENNMKIKELNHQLDEAKFQTAERDELIKLNSSLVKEKENEIINLRSQFDEANSKMAEEREELKKLNSSLLKEKEMKIDELRCQLQEANSKMAAERGEMNKLNAAVVDRKEMEVQALRSQFEEAMSKMTKEKDELNKLNASINKETNFEIQDLQRRLQEANSKMVEEREEFNKLNASIRKEKEDDMQDLRRQVEEANSKMMEDRRELVTLHSTVNGNKIENQNLRFELEVANSKMTEERNKYVELTKSIEKEKNSIAQDLRCQVDEASSTIANLKDTLKTSHEDKIRELKELKRDLENVTNEKAAQEKKTRKLAKLLKSTLNHVTRVSRMKMDVNLSYRDSKTGEYRRLPAEAEYSGPVVNSKPHGAGLMKFKCGDMYLGMFENGEINGEGSYITSPKKRRENGSSEKKKKQTTASLLFKGHFDRSEFSPSPQKPKENHVPRDDVASTKVRLFADPEMMVDLKELQQHRMQHEADTETDV